MNAIDVEMNRIHSTVESRIVVLASSWDLDELSFDILSDLANLLTVKLASCMPRESSHSRNHQCGGSRDSRSGGRFRIGFDCEAAIVGRTCGHEEMNQVRGQMMLNLSCLAELFEVPEVIFATGIDRFETNGRVATRNDLSSRKDIYRKINRHCSGMKQIKGPKIERAAREIDST